MGGKSGKNTSTLIPRDLAASSAHESGPEQPPETSIDSWGKDLTKALTSLGDWNLRDPTTPTFIEKDNTTIGFEKSSNIRHHRRSFMGCFSLYIRKNINYEAFLSWKDEPSESQTAEMAGDIACYITNYYDFITTAPPSKNRNLDNYCCFKLCDAVSAITKIPFIISFKQREVKSRHGRFASMEAEKPELVLGWDYNGKSILFIDDLITSGMTAKTCYESLRSLNNHVDGIIYCSY